MVITFVGHSSVFGDRDVKALVTEQIERIISEDESAVCFLGGYGQFDQICAYACKELKKNHPKVQTVLVTPYITLSEMEKIKEMINEGMYDEVIYPPIENTPKRFAISKRNEWMIKSADIVIAYVKTSYGGAYKSLQIAKRQKKRIINICDLI